MTREWWVQITNVCFEWSHVMWWDPISSYPFARTPFMDDEAHHHTAFGKTNLFYYAFRYCFKKGLQRLNKRKEKRRFMLMGGLDARKAGIIIKKENRRESSHMRMIRGKRWQKRNCWSCNSKQESNTSRFNIVSASIDSLLIWWSSSFYLPSEIASKGRIRGRLHSDSRFASSCS